MSGNPQTDSAFSISISLLWYLILGGGWIIVVAGIITRLTGAADTIDKLRSKVLTPLSLWFKNARLARSAIKADIRGHINGAIQVLAPQMPEDWISEIDIKWANNETKTQFFEDNKLIVHVRPFEDHDRNFVTVVNIFLKDVLFGNVRELIPSPQRTAAELMIGDRIACMRGATTANAFGKYIFEPAVANTKVEKYYHRYNGIDERGLFSGPFIREVKHVAEEVRVSRKKSEMGAEMNEALVFLEKFIEGLDRKATEGVSMPIDSWLRDGIMTKYGLLLVAHPSKAAADSYTAYLSRVQDYHKRGVARLYVLGSLKERRFATHVIDEINRASPYQLEQRFALYKDYRGHKGGIGAIFSLRPES